MAQNFNKMNKQELEAVLNSDSILNMNVAQLNELRAAVKAAGLLSVQYDNMLGIAINNQTYEEIKKSDKYTEEEKALALDARNEYNRELRARTKNKLYNAQEIMSRAVEIDGKYHFDNLTKGEMDFLLDNKLVRLNELIVDNNIESQPQYNAQEIMSRAVEVDGKYHFDNLSEGEKNFLLKNGIILQNELNDGKQYNIGQQADRNFTSEINKDNKNLSEDVKKSQEFWGKFNDNKSGIQYIVQALKDNSLKVEAQKDNKTIFAGVDHGNQGFDIVKKESVVEPYNIYDLIIKKAKIRIKDNVKDPIARNKILIACAKNNMEPVGNLPEGFDFAALKEMVKDAKDIATINALAENLYDKSKFDVVNADDKENKNRTASAVLINQGNDQQQNQVKDNKENKTIVAPLPLNMGGNNQTNSSRTNRNISPAATSTSQSEKKVVEAPKRPWWKKVRDAVVVAGIAFLGMIGVRSCQNQEKLEKNIKDLQEQVDKKSMEDCDALSAKFAEEYAKGYEDGKKDCEEQNKPAPQPVVKKKTPIKKTPKKEETVIVPKVVKTVIVPKFKPIEEKHKLEPIPEANPYDNLPELKKQDTVQKSTVPLEAVNTSIQHEKDFELNEATELDNKGKLTADNNKKKKTLDLSNPADFNAMLNSINSKIH